MSHDWGKWGNTRENPHDIVLQASSMIKEIWNRSTCTIRKCECECGNTYDCHWLREEKEEERSPQRGMNDDVQAWDKSTPAKTIEGFVCYTNRTSKKCRLSTCEHAQRSEAGNCRIGKQTIKTMRNINHNGKAYSVGKAEPRKETGR